MPMNVAKVRKRAVWPIVRKAFPHYRGNLFRVIPSSSVVFNNTLCRKGTVNTYKIVLLDQGRTLPLPASMEKIVEGETLPLTKGMALIEHQIFQGEDLGIRVWVHPETADKLIPSTAAEIAA